MNFLPEFLSIEDVLEIHRDQISRYGGASGIRDKNALLSAIEQPKVTYKEQFLHNDLWEMAAAYIFHLSQNHPFIDGNKRTALATGLIFLYLNDVILKDNNGNLYPLMIKVASGKAGKPNILQVLKKMYIDESVNL